MALLHGTETCSTLEKDDVIGCMIYCIVEGRIEGVQCAVQGLIELLGSHNELLSRRGVDSYRADLESAVQYLCEQTEQELITVPEEELRAKGKLGVSETE